MNASNVKYSTAGAGSTISAASFSNAAPLLIDNSQGDTATGYSFPAGSGSFSALIDLGSTGLGPILGFATRGVGGACGDGWVLYYSTNGTTWTQATTGSGIDTGGSQSSFGGITAQFWQFVASTASGSGKTLNDFRLFDGGGIVSVAAAPVAPAAPVIASSTSTTVIINAPGLTSNASSQNLQYSTDSTFNTGVSTLTGVTVTGTITVSGLTPLTNYYFRFVEVGAGGSTSGPYTLRSTGGTAMAVENASVLNNQQLFVETTPGVSGAATVRLLATQFNPDEVPDKKAHTQEGIKFAVEVTEGKESSSIKFDGQMSYLDMAYLCATCLVKPVITTPANSSQWQVSGASGTLGFTYKGQTVAPATYATLALMQAALAGLSTVGANNVVITGTVAAPLIRFVGALSTDTSVLTVAGTPTPTVAAVGTATLTRRFTFLIDPFMPDALQTYTIEKGIIGQSNMAEIISSVYGTSLSFSVNKSDQRVSGDMIGTIATDPSTMTSNPATGNVPVVPMTSKQFSVWLGDTKIGMARLTRVQEFDFNVGGRVSPIFTLDDSVPSFAAVAEGNVASSSKLSMVHNTESQAVLAAMRANAQKWLIYEAIGPVIETGFNYRFKVTMPVKVMNSQKQDMSGARGAVYDLQPKWDSTLAGSNGGAILVELDVPISALG